MSSPVHINSSSQWSQLLRSSSVVVADFYADWCGPCKMIAPVFESLATKHSKPGRVTFAKVNVDNQRDVASQYGVSAMPTFLVLHKGAVVNTIRGANPPALTAAVDQAVKLAAGPGASFSSQGRTLGGQGVGAGGAAAAGVRASLARPAAWNLQGLISAIITFFGLYFTSLFSLDPYKAAENSPYNKTRPPPAPRTQAGPGQKPGQRPAQKPAFKTLSDLGNE